MYIKTGNLQVDYTGLDPLQHVLGLVVLHKVLHDAGRNRAQLVTEDVRLQALQERPPGNVVHREPVIDPPKQDVSEIMECTLVSYVCQCSFLLFIPFREYSLKDIVSAHVFSSFWVQFTQDLPYKCNQLDLYETLTFYSDVDSSRHKLEQCSVKQYKKVIKLKIKMCFSKIHNTQQ